MLKNFSVWVGGSEVNDYLLTLDNAEALAHQWQEMGYEDVQIQLNDKEQE